MSKVLVRLCEEADLPSLREHDPRSQANYAAQHYEKQQGGGYLFATAWIDDQPLGYCALDLSTGKLQPELRSLWVFPKQRRRGAAAALTSFLEREAIKLGFTEVFLAVDPDNGKAIPLYIGLDYTPTGNHQDVSKEYVAEVGDHVVTGEYVAVYRKSLSLVT